MAVRIALSEPDDFSIDEEDVVVKQKPIAALMAARERDSPPPTLSSSSHSFSPNGGVTMLELATAEEAPVSLEAAIEKPLGSPQVSSSSRSSRSPMLWSRSEVAMTGSFTVAGRRCVVSVEDDQLHWVPEKRSSRGVWSSHSCTHLTTWATTTTSLTSVGTVTV